MEKAKLEEFNHWWIKGAIDKDLALPFKRDSYSDIERHLDKRFIIALVGLRRIGKTTMLYQLAQKLIDDGTNVSNVLFFSFDENVAKLSEVIDAYQEIQKKDLRNDKIFIFLDEIQKCKNWENELKKYYDLYPKLKFVISGSESLFIRKKTKETLAGRIIEFALAPFTFREYLEINGVHKEEFKYETRVKPFFMNFVKLGGFPETFTMESSRDFREYIRALVVDKIIYRDIPSMFKLEDPAFLGVLLELISTNPGMYIDYQSLSRQFEKDRRVIKDYIHYLKESFLIRMLVNYRKGSTSLRKRKKAYPADNALIALYKQNIEDNFFGKMVETLAVNTLRATSFWKNGTEVDIIHSNVPIEVKYQEKINVEDFKSLRDFMRKFGSKEGRMITKNEERLVKFEEGIVTLTPAWKWLLEKRG